MRAVEGGGGACTVSAPAGRSSDGVDAAACQVYRAHKIVPKVCHVEAARRVNGDAVGPEKSCSSSDAVGAPASHASAAAAGERRDAARRNINDANKVVDHVCYVQSATCWVHDERGGVVECSRRADAVSVGRGTAARKERDGSSGNDDGAYAVIVAVGDVEARG